MTNSTFFGAFFLLQKVSSFVGSLLHQESYHNFPWKLLPSPHSRVEAEKGPIYSALPHANHSMAQE